MFLCRFIDLTNHKGSPDCSSSRCSSRCARATSGSARRRSRAAEASRALSSGSACRRCSRTSPRRLWLCLPMFPCRCSFASSQLWVRLPTFPCRCCASARCLWIGFLPARPSRFSFASSPGPLAGAAVLQLRGDAAHSQSYHAV